jgi:hypothetical protein
MQILAACVSKKISSGSKASQRMGEGIYESHS